MAQVEIEMSVLHEETLLRNQALEEFYRNRVLFLAQTVANQKKAIDELSPPVVSNDMQKKDK